MDYCTYALKYLILLKCPYYTEAIYRFNSIAMKFFTELEQIILKFVWNHKRLQVAKTIFKKNKTLGITLSNFKLYYEVIIIKIVLYWL